MKRRARSRRITGTESLESRVMLSSAYHSLATSDFSQDWTDTDQITVNDDWSGVPSIIGYDGADMASGTDVDPQTVLGSGTDDPAVSVDVIANRPDPDAVGAGGVGEFEITNPTIALQGSAAADAPFIVVHLNTLTRENIEFSFNARDIEGTATDAVQQIAVHYRIGSTGAWTNLPAGYIADATTGGAATLETPVSVTLPAAAADKAEVQVRVMTTNANGADEWVGIDDIEATSTAIDYGVTITESGGSTDVAEDGTAEDTYTVALNTVPTAAVSVTVTADAQTVVSKNGTDFFSSVVLTITDDSAQTVTVRAVDDFTFEGGPHTGTITHAITTSGDSNYPTSTPVDSVVANVTDSKYHRLANGDYSQDWTDTDQITSSDDWDGVPSIIGYNGSGLTSGTDVDPQTVLGSGTDDPSKIDVIANRPNPDALSNGGVAEFHITDPTIGLQASNGADAPFIVLHLDTLTRGNIEVSFNVRDLDGSTDDAVQQIAVQYRVGTTGDWTNLPAGYIADATTGPSLATLVTPVSVTLPAAAADKARVQVRIMTTNADGTDEWVGIDDIEVTSTAIDYGVTITESDGSTAVSEATGYTDTYTVSLNSVPTTSVDITVTADADVRVSKNGTDFFASVVLTFTDTTAQTVTVRAVDDVIFEGPHTGTITHAITASGDSNYPTSTTIASVVASVADDDPMTGEFRINEVHFDPPGATGTRQYIELRGTPGGLVPADAYLVKVDGDGAGSGTISYIYEFGIAPFSSTGYLVLAPAGQPYGSISGLILESIPADDATSFTWLLITSAAAPTLGADIDANNDGTPDGGGYAGWTIRDSIAYLDGGAADVAYSGLAFSTNGSGISSGTIVDADTTLGYVGRLGNSTGSAASDWVASLPAGTSPGFTLGAMGATLPTNLVSAPLNHIGDFNFYNTPEVLFVAIDQASIEEDGGVGTATVSRTSDDVSKELVVTLSSDDVGEATVPMTVTILAGEYSATFDITAVNDVMVDGTQTATITASAAGYTSGSDTIDILDLGPGIVITESGESTDVTEGGPKDTYTIKLLGHAVSTFELTVTGDAQTLVSKNGTDFFTSVVLTYTTATLTRTVHVLAADDLDVEGPHTGLITHAITLSSDPNYPTSFVIDDVAVSITDNDSTPPVIGNFDDVSPGPGKFTENGIPKQIDSNALVTDVDGLDFDLGVLTVTLTAGGDADDRLAIRDQGPGTNRITVAGDKVSYSGVEIGSFTGGTDGFTPLVVTFNASATAVAVRAVLRNVTFENLSDNPSASRTVEVVLTDGDGGTSNTPSKTIVITPRNDAPVLAASAGDVNFTESGPAAVLFGDGTVFDIDDPADFDTGRLIVKVAVNKEKGDLIVFDTSGLISISGDEISHDGTLIGTFTGATSTKVVTFNANATPARVQDLLRSVSYFSDSTAIKVAPKTVSVKLLDGDGGGGTSNELLRTVTITSINNDPVIGNFDDVSPGSAKFTEDKSPALVDSNALLTDGDDVDFDGGTLTVTLTANAETDDRLSVRSQAPGTNRITVAGDKISYSGVEIGSFVGGTDGSTPLVVTFNAAATAKAVQATLRNVTFESISQNPSAATRTVEVVVTDGDGGTSNTAAKSIEVVPKNDAPDVSGFDGTSTYDTGTGDPVFVDADAVVTDVDSADFDGGKLTFKIILNIQGTDRFEIQDVGLITVSGTEVSYDGTVIGTFSGTTALSITLNSDADATAVTALVQAVTYHSISPTPSISDRTVQLIVQDGDAGTTKVEKTINFS